MHEKIPPFPTEPRLAKDYLANITRTVDYLEVRKEIHAEYGDQLKSNPSKDLARFVMQQTIARTAKAVNKNADKYEDATFSPVYNDILSTLPGLNKGLHNLDDGIGNRKKNLREVIPFNHAIKRLINENSSTTPANLEGMLKNTLLVGHYDSQLFDRINRHIIPGMSHELALESNLFYLPGEPEIIDTTVEDELKGIDYITRFKNGIEITIDGKASEEAAEKAQFEHDDWRERNRILSPDNHLILYTGYKKEDFILNKIGRVTEEARQREQPRIDTAIKQKYAELRRTYVTA
jgi:hypothetical protein